MVRTCMCVTLHIFGALLRKFMRETLIMLFFGYEEVVSGEE